MDLKDPDLVRALEARDGPLGSRWRPHRPSLDAPCPYAALYPQDGCPWCAAERRRAESGALPSPRRTA
ncbi:MAG TPA: hypothetical protein VNN10_06060 [Dehalococcoidia bacterium]|jgi:hypothetical protein|nr:hypothetical protein [Dehalococcoidia bacterium]